MYQKECCRNCQWFESWDAINEFGFCHFDESEIDFDPEELTCFDFWPKQTDNP